MYISDVYHVSRSTTFAVLQGLCFAIILQMLIFLYKKALFQHPKHVEYHWASETPAVHAKEKLLSTEEKVERGCFQRKEHVISLKQEAYKNPCCEPPKITHNNKGNYS